MEGPTTFATRNPRVVSSSQVKRPNSKPVAWWFIGSLIAGPDPITPGLGCGVIVRSIPPMSERGLLDAVENSGSESTRSSLTAGWLCRPWPPTRALGASIVNVVVSALGVKSSAVGDSLFGIATGVTERLRLVARLRVEVLLLKSN